MSASSALNIAARARAPAAAVREFRNGGSAHEGAAVHVHDRARHVAAGAVLAATRHLAGELAPLRIRINSISPGPTTTALNRDVFADEAAVHAVAGAVPLGRIGAPVDVVGAAVFLSCADSAYVTGIDIPVDGGFVSQVQLAPGANAYHGFRATSPASESEGERA